MDKARLDLRLSPRSTYCINRYEEILTQVKTKVLAVHSKVTREVETWDMTFTVSHGYEPSHYHYEADPKISSAHTTKRRSNELLKHWGITAHLFN